MQSFLAASYGTSTSGVIINVSTMGWGAEATSFQIYRGILGQTATLLATTPNSVYTDTNATPGVEYYYYARGVASSLPSAPLSPPSDQVSGMRAVAAPTAVVASDGTYADRVSVTFTVPGDPRWRVTNSIAARRSRRHPPRW